jgi:Helix-turn-helix domain
MVKRAYKYRFYPTPAQAQELSRTFGCVRKVHNLALEARTTAWDQRRERMTYLQSSALLTRWKHSGDLAYLNRDLGCGVAADAGHAGVAFPRNAMSCRAYAVAFGGGEWSGSGRCGSAWLGTARAAGSSTHR